MGVDENKCFVATLFHFRNNTGGWQPNEQAGIDFNPLYIDDGLKKTWIV
jgi:hypothetical protein